MFTGIVEELGAVVALEDQGDAVRLTVEGPLVTSDVKLGDSVSVNGCCLTVAVRDAEQLTFDMMRETLDKTSLGALSEGDRVNLERAVTPTGRLGGHIVQGHVDGTGALVRRTPSEHWEVVEVELPGELARYVVPKGSVTVDGVSLTVNAIEDTASGVNLMLNIIPHTAAVTTFGALHPGQAVNLEIDVLARYLQRMEALRGKA